MYGSALYCPLRFFINFYCSVLYCAILSYTTIQYYTILRYTDFDTVIHYNLFSLYCTRLNFSVLNCTRRYGSVRMTIPLLTNKLGTGMLIVYKYNTKLFPLP